MPRLVPYEQRTNLSGESLGPQPMGPNAGALALSHALIDAGDSVALVQHRDAVSEASTGLATLRDAATRRMADAQQNATGDAAGFTDRMLEGFDEDVRSATDAATSPAAKRIIREQSQELRGEFLQRSIHFEAGARSAYRADAALQNADKVGTALEIDPSQWQKAGQEQMAAIDAMQLGPEATLELKRRVDARLTEGAASGRAKQAPLATLQALEKGGDPMLDGLSIEQRHRVEARARGELVDQTVSAVASAYQKGGPESAQAALGRIQNDKTIPDDLRAQILASSNGAMSQIREQRREQFSGDLTRVATDIATGQAGTTTHDSVDHLYKVGALTPSELASLHAEIDRSQIENARKNAGAEAVMAALRAGIPLDPKDEGQRKAYSAAFGIDTASVPVGSQSWQSTAQAYAQRARMLPDQATAWTRQAMRSPDPQLAANAAQFYGAVKTAVPDAVSGFDDDTKAFAATVNSMIEAGTAPARAVETARSTVFDANKTLTEARKHAWSGAGNASLASQSPQALANFIGKDFNAGWFHSNPTAIDPNVARAAGAKLLQTDFDDLSEKYFLKTGDATVARQAAWDDLKHVYGPSKVNGGSAMMAFPPERFGVTPDEVRKELDGLIATTPQADGSKASEITLVPDSLTMRDAADALNGQPVRPSYQLVTKSGDLVLDKSGAPIRYTIPTGEELGRRIQAAQAEAAAAAQKQVEAARAARAQREVERRVQAAPYGSLTTVSH